MARHPHLWFCARRGERNRNMTAWIVVLIVIGVIIVLALIGFLLVLPDLRRYRRIRSM